MIDKIIEKEKPYFKGDFEIIGNILVSYKGKDTDVTIPNGIIKIGYEAFLACKSLTSITIPNSVTYIGDKTFYGCSSLTSVTIPNSVTHIGINAFEVCTDLIDIKIPERFKDEVTLKEIGFDNYQIYLILKRFNDESTN